MSNHARTSRPRTAPTSNATSALPAHVAPVVRAGTQSGGQSLDRKTQNDMAARFGHDFSQVRIHTDSRAEDSALSLGANAYTVGTDIVFGSSFTPGSLEGERLLAHELTHVVQQSQGGVGDGSRTSSHGDASEREADSLASQVMQGKQVRVQAAPDAAIARDSFWDDWKFLPPVPKTSTDDTYDQRPGGPQDRDRKRQQDQDKQDAQRRGETDPRPNWWDNLLHPAPAPLPSGPDFRPKSDTLPPLTFDPSNPFNLPKLPGVPSPTLTPTPAPAPSDAAPAPTFPPPISDEIPGAPNPYVKDDQPSY